MARLAAARRALTRLRCWWSWPLGHADEVLDYVDPLSGRWAARARCVACGRESALVVGRARTGAVFAGNPFATSLAPQGSIHGGSTSVKRGPGPPPERHAGLVVRTPAGTSLVVRQAPVRYAFGLRRAVYCVRQAGETRAETAGELGPALARAARVERDDPWLERIVRELEGELTSRL